MSILRVQIEHSLTASPVSGVFTGLIAFAKLIDANQVLDSIELSVKRLSMLVRNNSSGSYTTLQIGADNDVLASVSAIIPTATLEIELAGLKSDGSITTLRTHSLQVDDYRADFGAANKTITLTSRDEVTIPAGIDLDVSSYSSKVKLQETGSTIWVYGVNPNDLRLWTLGANFTDGQINGVIDSIDLTIDTKKSITKLRVIEI